MYTLLIEIFKQGSGKKVWEFEVSVPNLLFLEKEEVLQKAKTYYSCPEEFHYLQSFENGAKVLTV